MKVEFIVSGTPQGDAAKEIAREVSRITFGNPKNTLGVSMAGLCLTIACAAKVVAKGKERDWINQIHQMTLAVLDQQDTEETVQ